MKAKEYVEEIESHPALRTEQEILGRHSGRRERERGHPERRVQLETSIRRSIAQMLLVVRDLESGEVLFRY